MDFSRIIQMILNRLLRRAVNTAVDHGIDYAARRGKPADQMTAADHAQAQEARVMAKRARQAAKLTRRL